MFLRDVDEIRNNLALADASGSTRTYGELEELSEEYLKWVPKRSLVFILCDYHIDTVSFYYCMMNNHVVPLLLDKKIDMELLTNLVRIYQPQYIWMEKERQEDFPGLVLHREYVQHGLFQTSYKKYEIYSELALLFTTSGSTGSPKLVRVSYENLRCNAKSFAKVVKTTEEDKYITTLPLQFCYGVAVLHMHWISGALTILTEDSMLSQKFWDLVEEKGVTNFAGVPYTYEILKQIGFLERIPASLRFLTEGGGKLPKEFQQLFGEKLSNQNVALYLCYGQTEATGLIATLPAEEVLNKMESVGIIIPGMEAFIEGQEQNGEIVLKGSSISLGYAEKRSDLLNQNDNKNILYTGDFGFIDAEGFIYLYGRLSRILKVLGVRVNLDEMEHALQKQFLDCEFACTGEDNFVQVFYTGLATERALKEFCERKFQFPKKLLHFHKIQQIPRNQAGKILYKKLR